MHNFVRINLNRTEGSIPDIFLHNSSPTSRSLRDKLRDYHIVWLGTKATDAVALCGYGRTLSAISFIGGDDSPDVFSGYSLEDELDLRIDYDSISWDELPAAFAEKIIRKISATDGMLQTLIAPFYASQLVCNAALVLPNTFLAGNSFFVEAGLNHKPSVEQSLRKAGVPIVEWRHQIPGAVDMSQMSNSALLRQPASTGGIGHKRLGLEELRNPCLKFKKSSDIYSCCRYIEHSSSITIGACVFDSGHTTLHPPSIQIIGESLCTNREFGYCGNDFYYLRRELTHNDIDKIEAITRTVGIFLHRIGYRGAFGVDFMNTTEGIYVSEINPRFQASAFLSAIIMAKSDLPDIYTDHISAHLGLEPMEYRPSLSDLVQMSEPLAQVFCFNVTSSSPPELVSNNGFSAAHAPSMVLDLLPRTKNVKPHSLMFRMISHDCILENGKTLTERARQAITSFKTSIANDLLMH